MESKSYHHSELGPAHEAIVGMVKPGARVLEIGCATGYMTRALKERLDCRVTAVEIDAAQAASAEPYAERLIVDDIGNPDIWEQMGDGFDYVIFADVLEHLADPWEALRRSANVLRSDGQVLASIPNIAYYKVRKDLLLGRFDYADYGVLDNTHLRFFTAGTAAALFTGTGYEVLGFLRTYRGRVDRTLGRLAPNAFAYQFVIRAEK